MKFFEKGQFACPVHYGEGGIDGNGQQYIFTCLECRLDNRDICCGTQLVCENNYNKNSYSLFLMKGTRYGKNIKKGKDETLSLKEVLKFAETLLEH